MNEMTETVNFNDRISVFKHLTVDKLTNAINQEIFSGLLKDFYDDFVKTCDYVRDNANKIKSVSCYIQNGEIRFEYEYY